MKFHIRDNGDLGICRAKDGNCPLKNSDGSAAFHFDNKKDAFDFYEEKMKDNMFFSLDKKEVYKEKSLSKNNFDYLKHNIPDKELVDKVNRIWNYYNLDSTNAKNLSDVVFDLKDYFTLTYFMNAQQKSSDIENIIARFLHGEKVSSSLGKGDIKVGNNYYELKTSTTNKGENLNIRQIRLWQDVNFYLCSYINELELSKSKTFKLTKKEMQQEVNLIGGFTHGTKEANLSNINNEYSITINISKENEVLQRWINNYWDNDFYNFLLK